MHYIANGGGVVLLTYEEHSEAVRQFILANGDEQCRQVAEKTLTVMPPDQQSQSFWGAWQGEPYNWVEHFTWESGIDQITDD